MIHKSEASKKTEEIKKGSHKIENFKPREEVLTEKELRIQLAAAYRIFNHFNWDTKKSWGLVPIKRNGR